MSRIKSAEYNAMYSAKEIPSAAAIRLYKLTSSPTATITERLTTIAVA